VNDRIVQYLVLNREIVGLGPGVVATQAAHAALAGYLAAAETEAARAWAAGTFTKIILVADDEPTLERLDDELTRAGVVHRLLAESRLGGKRTAIGVAPLPKSAVAPILGRLALLR
jgi:peptidyl-tRNA hydrolase